MISRITWPLVVLALIAAGTLVGLVQVDATHPAGTLARTIALGLVTILSNAVTIVVVDLRSRRTETKVEQVKQIVNGAVHGNGEKPL